MNDLFGIIGEQRFDPFQEVDKLIKWRKMQTLNLYVSFVVTMPQTIGNNYKTTKIGQNCIKEIFFADFMEQLEYVIPAECFSEEVY